MPLERFICPDGQSIETKECLKEGGCRLKERCCARPILKLMAQNRKWEGVPSTTQLLKGTMQAFLEIVHDYEQKPDDMAFRVQGSVQHANLEGYGDEISQAELDFSSEKGSIRPDVLEYENGEWTLLDYKMSGSFAVAKALGIYKEDEPVVDAETGEPVLYKSGQKKGQPKTVKVVKRDPRRAEMKEWIYQLNNYRVGLEREVLLGPDGKLYFRKQAPKGSTKIKFKRLKVQVVVRDGNTVAALSRGIDRNIYYIDIPIIPDDEVKEYFSRKRKHLLQAVEQGDWQVPCTEDERWQDHKCLHYCPVNKHCPYFQATYAKDVVDGKREINPDDYEEAA